MDIYIATASTEHLTDILKIINYHILNTTAIYDYKIRTFEEQLSIFNHKKNNDFPLFVAIENETVIGFATYDNFRNKAAFQYTVEHSIYIDNNHQGKGIGKLLMKKLIDYAKQTSIKSMIGVIDNDNIESIKFHEQFGFINIGKITSSGYKFDKWLDTVFMQLIIS